MKYYICDRAFNKEKAVFENIVVEEINSAEEANDYIQWYYSSDGPDFGVLHPIKITEEAIYFKMDAV